MTLVPAEKQWRSERSKPIVLEEDFWFALIGP